MKLANIPTLRPLVVATVLAASVSACSSIAYRCPLDPTEKADSPTACAGMKEALEGAKHGTGSNLSVLTDSAGARIPIEILDHRPAVPSLSQLPGSPEPYHNPTGTPVFEQPRVFQTLVPAFVDAEGNLHDAHTAWFSTPGRWSYGTLRGSGPAAGGGMGDLMRPVRPDDMPAGKISVKSETDAANSTNSRLTQAFKAPPLGTAGTAATAAKTTGTLAPTGTNSPTSQAGTAAAMQNLSTAAAQASKSTAPAGLTAPALNLGD